MHLEYGEQLRMKRDKLQGLMKHDAGVYEAAAQFGYRNRMQFHSDGPITGLMAKKESRIIPIDECPIADKGINKWLKEEKEGKKEINTINERTRFTVYSKDDCFLQEGDGKTANISLLGKHFMMNAGVFFQSNSEMFEKLLKKTIDIAEEAISSTKAIRNMPAADFYCGVGVFGAFLQDFFPSVELFESAPESANFALQNLDGTKTKVWNLSDIAWADMQRNNPEKARRFGLIVADPPRNGLARPLVNWLCVHGPAVFIYVSCNPASLARDAASLCKSGYSLQSLELFDFYPQTSHIESLAVFKK